MCNGVSGAGGAGNAGNAGAAQQQRVAAPNVGGGADQVAQMLQQFIAQLQQSNQQAPPGTLGLG